MIKQSDKENLNSFGLSIEKWDTVNELFHKELHPKNESIEIIETMIKNHVPNIFKFLKERNYCERFIVSMINIAVLYNNFEFLDYVRQLNVESGICTSLYEENINLFKAFLNYPVLNFIGIKGKDHSEITQNFINDLINWINDVNVDTYKFLAQHNIFPSFKSIFRLIEDDDEVMLWFDYLIENKIYPTDEDIKQLEVLNQNEILQKLSELFLK